MMPAMISRSGLQSTAGIALAAVLLVAVILLAEGTLGGARVDLTADELYTVSPETRAVLGDIEEPVTLTLYFSHAAAEGVPFVRQYAQRVKELLQEYAAYSDGMLRLRTVDPKPLTEARDDAARYGLQPVPAGTTDAKIYLGLVGTNSTDGLEVIEFFDPQRERFLEYDITRAIWSLSNPDKPVVGIMSRLDITESYNPTTGRPRPAWAVVDRVRQIAEVREVETPTDTIDPAIDVLMLVHPHGYDDGTLYAIDQFLTHGGRAAVFLDPVAGTGSGRRDGGSHRSRSDPGPLLEAWGVDVTLERALADPRHGLVVSRGEAYGRTVHPGLVGITRPGMAERDVITAAVERLVFGSAGAISDVPGGLDVTPLVQAPNSSALLPAERFVGLEDPSELARDFRPDRELHTVVARLDGELRSAWPDGPPEGGVPPADGHRAAAGDEAHLVLFADTDVLADRLWVRERDMGGRSVRRAWAGNGDLVANAINNLTGSEALIRIRGEGTSARPFTRVEALEREAANRYRDKERELRQALAETEKRLEALRSGEDDSGAGGGVILSDEQRAELERYRERRARLRAELREVQQRLDAEIEALGNRLKLLNIAAMPVLVALAAVIVFALRRRRRRRAPGAR